MKRLSAVKILRDSCSGFVNRFYVGVNPAQPKIETVYSLNKVVELNEIASLAKIFGVMMRTRWSRSMERKEQLANAAYSADFNQWLQRTAQLLREHRWQEIDIESLVEEVESLGKSERRAIASQLTRLLLHLLKWHYQP